MREEIINFGESASLVGILNHTEGENEEQGLCAIFLNAGLIHKIGPNRLYVKLARCLAGKGVCCFRFDYSGLGDSGISKMNRSLNEIKNGEIKQAMDVVQKNIGIKRFVLIGICTGAEDAFRVSSEDTRIAGLLLIDGVYQDKQLLKSIYPIAARNCVIRYYKKHMFDYKRWAKVFTGKSGLFNKNNLIAAFKMLLTFLMRLKDIIKKDSRKRKSNTEGAPIQINIEEWKKLFERDIKIYLVFCEGGNAIDVFNLTVAKQLDKYKKSGLLSVDFIKDVDHTFTPIWSQELLTNLISNWVNIKLD